MFTNDKHQATYTDKLNAAVAGFPEIANLSAEELLADNLAIAPPAIKNAVRNNGGGFYHHSLFWNMMAPAPKLQPAGELANAIDTVFGDFDTFKEKLTAAALDQFGSGWAWLTADKDARLFVESTLNQDSPVSFGHLPIIGIDVWEHAYYLKYQNRRKDYVAAWWNIANWEEAMKRFAAANLKS